MKSAGVRRSRLGDVPLGKARIQSLSDAVFAFSLALMIYQVKIPVVAPSASRAELLASLPGPPSLGSLIPGARSNPPPIRTWCCARPSAC